jgi:hypothetical protein
MRTILPILFIILVSARIAHAADVPYVTASMREPGYWIQQQSLPDRVVMDPQGIVAFNQGLYAQGLCDDLSIFPSVWPGEKLKMEIEGLAMNLSVLKLFDRDGHNAGPDLYATWTENMALDVLGNQVRVRYAFTSAFTNQRLLPTDDPLYDKPGDVNFDQVQNSGLDPATPLVVLHESADGSWLYVKDGISSGWVKREEIAFCDKSTWLRSVTGKNMAVVTAARTAIYLDATMVKAVAVARMGSRFVIKRAGRGFMEIVYPLRHSDGTARFVSGFILPTDIMRGFLPYTPRIVITQAFKLLDAPYGWGDMHGDQDCSRFIHMVFATMGLDLPRNSTEQARSGLSLAEFNAGASLKEKLELISSQGLGGLVLLRLKGHIMLYLGQVKDRLYAIHAIWAYREKGPQGDVATVLGRVVVSDLSLGEGSSRGSLLERVVAVRLLKGDNPDSGVGQR